MQSCDDSVKAIMFFGMSDLQSFLG